MSEKKHCFIFLIKKCLYGSNYVAIKNIATKIGYYNGNDAKLNTFFNTAS